MEDKFKMETEVKEEPEEESVVKQSSNSNIDEARNVKQEPEIHIEDELPQSSVILEREQTEDPSVTNKKNKIKNLQCEKCLKYFSTKGNLKAHQKKLHEDERDSYDCDQCSRSFDTRKKLADHKRTHRERTIKCDTCDRLFTSKQYLIWHQKSHEGPQVLECAVCNKKCNRKISLQRHMLTHKKDRELFSCDFCESQFKEKRILMLHTLSKHMKVEAKFFCDLCPKSFNHRDLLRLHMKTHTFERCKICGKKMVKLSLVRHMQQVHGDNLKLKCPKCPKTFKTKINLKLHMACHEKKFECEICNRKFAKKYHLTDHLQWHEDPNIFSCNMCNKSYKHRENLSNHRYRHHRGEKI